MIILIGGSSHVGKTLLAQKMMEELKIPYLSLDHLKMMFIRGRLTDLTTEDDYEMRYFLWPYAAELIKTAIENDQNMIVEGCYIPSEWREQFDESYLKDIKCFFITMSEEYLKENISKLTEYGNVIEKRLDDEVDLERLINCSKEFKQEAGEHDIPVIEITDKYDIEEILTRALNIVNS
ncbi:MAG: ATP-binding protein [Lachnospiraceae bacterium]|nr:ATP-binding protein [Lachnospiraceae bacterium]